ncbi:hypothetical protein AS144_05235 [Francisella endosymbiont of Amblyomma maculatum]|nr:hypothetical protein AS144_05235 [Francisella endosymbiont of Amblyomma maculatum]
MKKFLVIAVTSLLTLSALYAKDNTIKGSDYISTDVDTIYTYVISDANDPNKFVKNYELIIKSCNKDKTQCTYDTK